MHASTSKSLFSPTSCKLYQSQLPLACFCFCWFRVYTRSGRLRASKPMGCKKLWTFDAEKFGGKAWQQLYDATTLRRCGDAIWWKFGKKQSYTHGFCHGNMRTREAGWKVDHRLTAFQLNVSLVFFSIFIFTFLSMTASSSEEKSRWCTQKLPRSDGNAQRKRQAIFFHILAFPS